MPVIPDVLRNAADIIDSHGWTRGKDVDSSGVCANGALRLALGQVVQPSPVLGLVNPDGWTQEQVMENSKAMTATHRVLDEYMIRFGILSPTAFTVISGDPRPRIVRYNDGVADNPGQVTKVLRDAADWVESAPVAELEHVVAAGLAEWPAFVPDSEMVSA